jgi:hypothetical protein
MGVPGGNKEYAMNRVSISKTGNSVNFWFWHVNIQHSTEDSTKKLTRSPRTTPINTTLYENQLVKNQKRCGISVCYPLA